MDIVPVIDLLNGKAVAAVRGERASYRPVKSKLVDTADPLDVARALIDATRCKFMYVADLDAIQGRLGHWDQLRELCRSLPVEFLVDAGVSNPEEALHLVTLGVGRVILGTETLPSLSMLDDMVKKVGRSRVLPSLDVKNGKILTNAPELKDVHPLDGLARMVDMGLDRFILLTLDVVGTGSGPDWPLLEKAVKRFPGIRCLAGGGVSTVADLRTAASLGLEGVLTASALHKGWITGRDLETGENTLI